MPNLIDWSSLTIAGRRLLVSNSTLDNSTDGMIADAISADATSSNSATDFNNNTYGDDFYDVHTPDDDTDSEIAWHFAVVIGVFVFLILLFGWIISIRNNNNNNNNAGHIRRSTIPVYAAQVRKMTPEERIALYNNAFDMNKNQVILTPNHIIVKDHYHSSQQHDSDDDGVDSVNKFDNTSDHSVYLSLEYARAQRRSTLLKQGSSRATNMTNSNKKSVTSRSSTSSIVHPRDHNDNNGGGGGGGSSGASIDATGTITDNNSTKKKDVDTTQRTSSVTMTGNNVPSQAVIRGECVICFDNMEVGDFIVWSESTSCRHVYHKECMVTFLAHKRRNTKTKMEAPCPTCRQHYVTVIEPPPEENEKGDTNGDDNDNNNDNDNVVIATTVTTETDDTATTISHRNSSGDTIQTRTFSDDDNNNSVEVEDDRNNHNTIVVADIESNNNNNTNSH